MNKFLMGLLLVSCLFSCSISHKKKDEDFVSRLHTPKEKVDWYRILGSTSLNKHLADFDAIDWEKEFWEEYKSENYNNSFLEVMDTLNNTFLDVSTFPDENNSYQFAIYIGSRSIKDKAGEIIEQGYVRCWLLGSDDSQDVKRLMKIFFARDYDKLFLELDELQVLFETKSVYQNVE